LHPIAFLLSGHFQPQNSIIDVLHDKELLAIFEAFKLMADITLKALVLLINVASPITEILYKYR